MSQLSRRDLVKLVAGAAAIPAVAGLRPALGQPPTRNGGGTGCGDPAELTGRLVFPGDADYDAARELWDRLFQSRPRVIAFCESEGDVVNAIAWARQNGVPLRARSGRHSLAGWSSVDGGVVIDVSSLKSVEIDAQAGVATVGAGLNQGELVNALGAAGFAVPTGSEASVGLGGVTLGGGIGYLARSMGLTCDNLIGVRIAVPDGCDGARLIRADSWRHANLLWGCRGGGGGNFGIATAFTFRLHPIGDVAVVEATWSLEDLPAVFPVWQQLTPAADRRLGTTLAAVPGAVALTALFAGPLDEALEIVAPLLAIGAPKVSARSESYVAAFNRFNEGPRTWANWKFTSSWAYRPFGAEAIEIVRDFASRGPTPVCNFWCLSWGGAVAREPAGGSAFVHREALFYAEPGAGWNDPALTPACEAWVAEFTRAMRPHVRGGYVNVPNSDQRGWALGYYGHKLPRLSRVKAAYDPQGVFRFEQSIPPWPR
jgi:FAD/FMN-containing dehydrogenase